MASSSSSSTTIPKVPITIQPSNSSLQTLSALNSGSNKDLPHRPQSQVNSQFDSNSYNSSSNQNPFESKLAREEENTLLNDSGSDSNMSFGGLIRGEKGKGRAGSDRSNYNYINPITGRPRYEDSPSGSVHSFPPTGSSTSTYSQYSNTAQSITAALNSTSPSAPPLPIPTTNQIQPTHRQSMHSSINSTTPSHPRPRLHSSASSMIGIPEHLIVFGTKPQGIIGKHKPREIIRVERDYSAGDVIQFWSGWVWELEGRISPTEYQNTLNELNTILASAHDPYASCFDNSLAILTLYLSPMFIPTHYKREMNRFERLLNRVNRDLFNPSGLHLLSPQKVAFLFVTGDRILLDSSA